MIKRYRYKYEDMYELRITKCETRGRRYINARVDKQKQAPKFTPILKEHEYHREYLQVVERKDAGQMTNQQLVEYTQLMAEAVQAKFYFEEKIKKCKAEWVGK